jgi:hypothetical protein
MSLTSTGVAKKLSTSCAFYTYAHINPTTNKIFYIGKGKSYRATQTSKRNQHWQNIVNKHGFKAEILAYWDLEQEALDHEKLLISCFRDMGYKLANKADGGSVNSGWKHTEQYKEFMKSVNKGKIVSAETKQKLKISALKRPKRVISDAQKEKTRLALIGRKFSTESIEKMSIAKKARNARELAKKEQL